MLTAVDRPFVGYRQWENAPARIHVRIKEVDPHQVEVHLHCPGASTFKISNNPDFPGTQWRDMIEKIDWHFDTQDPLAVVWVIFKRLNRETQKYEISSPLAYAIDTEKPFKKIELCVNGYMDWTEWKLIQSATVTPPSKKRYDYSWAQKKAEEKLTEQTYDVLKSLFFEGGEKLGQWTKRHRWFGRRLMDYLSRIQIKGIHYPEERAVSMESEIFLVDLVGDEKFLWLEKVHPHSPPVQVKSYLKTKFHLLILDVRGLDYTPCFYPEIISENDELVLDRTWFTNRSVPYVRYLRTLKGYEGLPLREGDRGGAPSGRYRLYVRALDLVSGDKSRIVVTERYKTLIHANPQTLFTLANGHFYILMD